MTPFPNIAELTRIKRWLNVHRGDHPVEYHFWDAVMTVWFLGLIGWLPAFLLEIWWAVPACVIMAWSPAWYLGMRARAHATARLRCDWLDQRA
jgi:hypothetical protein